MRALVVVLLLVVAASGPGAASPLGPLPRAPLAFAEVVAPSPPPPAIGPLVAEDPLTEDGVLREAFCPTGRSSGQTRPDGFRMSVTGRCQASVPDASYLSRASGVTLADGEIELEVSGDGATPRAVIIIFVRLQAGFNGYQVAWSPATGTAELRRLREGRGVRLASRTDLPPVPLAEGAKVGLRARGPTIWLLINGEPVLAGTDDAPDAIDTGAVGLGLIRQGDPDDAPEVGITWRNLRLSRLAEGDVARAPNYHGPAGATGPFVPAPGTPPAVGTVRHDEPMNQQKFAPFRQSLFLPYECPTGNGSIDFADEGLRLETHGKCYDTSVVATIGTFANPLIDLPDAEIRFEYKITSDQRRAMLHFGVRVQEEQQDGLYSFTLIPGRGVVGVTRLDRGGETVLGQRMDVRSVLTRDDWNSVSIRMLGPKLWLLLNDRPALAVEDSALGRGTFHLNLRRLGDPNDTEQVAILLRNLRISDLKEAPKNRRPQSIFFFDGPTGR